jgi:hypothetical protein
MAQSRSHITTYLDDHRVSCCGCFVMGVSTRFRQCEVTTSCLDIVILFFLPSLLLALWAISYQHPSFSPSTSFPSTGCHFIAGAGTPILPLIYLPSSPVNITHSHMHHRFYYFSIVLIAVLVFLRQASAAPTPAWSSTKTHFHRQGNGDLSVPFTTHTVQTTQTCVACPSSGNSLTLL